MRLLPLACVLFCCLARPTLGQTLVLETFNAGSSTGAVRPGTSWVNQVTSGANTITVGGAALDDNGWAATGQSINATGMGFLAITAQRDPGHAANAVAVQFEDRNLNTQVFTVNTSAFAAGSLTLVNIPIAGWTGGFDPSQIVSWSIGGGSIGTSAFRMTFDQLAFTMTATGGSAVVPGVTGDYGARTRAPGESITFSITASGTAPLSYQWLKNGSPVTGNATATTSALTLGNLSGTDAGSYTCVVTNSAGSATSGAFTLTVTATPATVVLGSLAHTFDGTQHRATATTTPTGLPVTFTYAGGSTAPIGAGSYPVVATVNHPSYSGRAEGTLVILRAPQSINYATLPVTLNVGTAFTISATSSSGDPVVFTLSRGNAQLTGNSLTPLDTAPITIRATQAGTSNYLSATTDFSFSAAKQNQSIAFASVPSALTSTTPITLSATASSNLPVSFHLITGPATLVGSTLTPGSSGLVIVRASQPGNDSFNAAPDVDRSIVVTGPEPAAVAPVIVRSPVSQSIQVGAPLSLTVDASGTAPLTYQWFKDGTAIPGATDSVLALGAATSTNAGAYSVSVNNRAGSATSPAANITVAAAATPEARLSNFSTRAPAESGDRVVIAGFSISGNVPKPILVRAVGPTLATFDVTSHLLAPVLELFEGSRSIAKNVGWTTAANPAALAAAAEQVGGFPLRAGSTDSALLVTLPPGNYSAVMNDGDQRTGIGLIEVYDLSSPVRGQKINNLSIRAPAGVDADTLIVGLVVDGTSPKRLLVRAVGPSLAQFNVSGVLARPQLAVFSGSTEIARNAGWSTGSYAVGRAQTDAESGAFIFEPGTLDSALVLQLAPGSYTAQVSGVDGTSGVALVEVYELP